jgi:hypothetical protein
LFFALNRAILPVFSVLFQVVWLEATSQIGTESFTMTKDASPTKNRSAVGRRALREQAAPFVLAMLFGCLFLVADFQKERPNFYQPARAPLVDAAMILPEIYGDERELAQKFQTVNNRLNNAIALLGQAERLDPEDKQKIETLQVRLRALDDIETILSTDPKTLQRAYQGLAEQLSTLVDKLEQRPLT